MPTNAQTAKTWAGQHKGTFLGQALTLATGAGLAQIITVLAAPFLARLFTPAEFGVLGIFLSLMVPLTAIASLKYELAVVTAKSDPQASNVLALSALIAIGVALLAAIAAWLAAPAIARLLGSSDLAPFLWLIPLGVLFGGGHRLGLFWATRRSHFTIAASADVVRAAFTTSAQGLLGILSFGPAGLILGQLFGHIMGAATLMTRIVAQDLHSILRQISWRRIRATAIRFKDFPRYQAPKALLNSATKTLPPLLLAAFFGPIIAGLYWFTHRLLMMPITLFGNAVNRVFLKNAAERDRSGQDTFALWWRVTGILALLGAAVCGVLLSFGPALFDLIFGARWREAGHYAGWMSIWFVFLLAAVPAQSIFIISGRQKLLLMLELVYLIPRILIIPLAAMLGSARDAILGYSLAGALFNICLISIAYVLCSKSPSPGQTDKVEQ